MARDGRSRLDPYHDEIAKLLAEGKTYQEIADRVQEHTDEIVPASSVAYYVRHKDDLTSRVTRGRNNGRVHIPHCECCPHHVAAQGAYDQTKIVRVCMRNRRQIPTACPTSPKWCERRELHGV